jgi:hypothetical protein
METLSRSVKAVLHYATLANDSTIKHWMRSAQNAPSTRSGAISAASSQPSFVGWYDVTMRICEKLIFTKAPKRRRPCNSASGIQAGFD